MKKLKSLKLMLLGLVALVSSNAFGADVDITKKVKVTGSDDVVYAPVVDGKSPLKYRIIEVMDNGGKGAFNSGKVEVFENGTEMKGVTSITIGETVSIPVTIEKDGNYTEGTYSFKITKIGNNSSAAFTKANSNAMTSITLGANITDIANDAFNGDEVLTSITLNSGLKNIGNNAFLGVPLTELELPATLVTIGDNAFKADGKMGAYTAVTIPATVTTIGVSAFEGNENLQTVTIAANSQLKTIGDGAFAWTMVKSLDLTSATKWYNTTQKKDEGMTAFGTPGTDYGPFTSAAHTNNFMITEVKLPATCVTVQQGAFAGLTNLNSLGDNSLKYVHTIGANAFDGCAKLPSVTIATSQNNGITSIAADAFANCAKLATVEFGKIGAEDIVADDAFSNAGVKTFKFNAITAKLSTTAYNLASVTTLYFQSYIATADLVPSGAFTDAFAVPVPAGVEYHVYYNVTPPSGTIVKGINANAFSTSASVARVIKVHTNNAIYDAADLINKATILGDFSGDVIIGTAEKKLLKDKNSSYYYYYFKADGMRAIKKVNENGAKVNVYQVYVDESDQTIYFMPLRAVNGEYVVANNQVVIVKSNKEDGVKATLTANASTMAYDGSANPINSLQLLDADKSLLALQATEFLDNGANDLFFLKNPTTEGFGFAKFDMAVQTAGLKTNAVYLTCPALAAGAPVREVWLDEEGNMTAIKTIETATSASSDNAIYNLQGVRVSGAAQKGIYIKNGKKFVVK